MTPHTSTALASFIAWRPYPLRDWLCIVAVALSALLWGGYTAYSLWVRAEASLVTQKGSVSDSLQIDVETLKGVAAQIESRATATTSAGTGDLRDPRLGTRKK